MASNEIKDNDEVEMMISDLVNRARVAQQKIADYSQQKIDELCVAAGWQVYEDSNIEKLAKLAVEETGMGNVSDKIKKHKGKILGVLKDLKGAKSVGLIEVDENKGIYKYAKPVGVVGALTPVTNPTATPGSNALSILKGRNAVIFAPHPRAAKSSALAVEMMRNGLEAVGAPADLIQIIDKPSIPATQVLMREVDLVLATGGGAMVKAAYSSGTPAYGVGPGNSVQLIAEDADVSDAAAKIALSKCFDNATSCSSENSVIVHENIYDQFISELETHGGWMAEGPDRATLEKWMWVPGKKGKVALNPKIIAKDASVIAQDAGVSMPSDKNMIIVEGTEPLEKDHFAGEKLSPVLTVWKYSDFEEGFDLLKRLIDNAGTGHSCGIFTQNQQYITRLGEQMKTSRILVNQPQAPGNGGNFWNGMPSTVTLGCGTWGGNITTENITYKHFLNITWVSQLIPADKPSDEEIFGSWVTGK
ncbi:MAG: aldehyde dehydrogenase family protein [Sphaerochaetaceae bacterium]|nr:aldehyde dehydrogenase family protein [Sphaerochaetaceae bacterium]